MKHILMALAFLAGMSVISAGAQTFDPTQPVSGQPYTAAPIRNNFQAVENQILALQGSNIGPTQPFVCNLANQGRWWINNTSTVWIYNVCDGPGGAWDAVFTVNSITHLVGPPPGLAGQRTLLTAPITLYVS